MEYILYIIVLVFSEGEETGKPSPSLKNDDMKKDRQWYVYFSQG